MPEPRTPKGRVVSTRVSDHVHERLERWATESERTLSAVVARILERADQEQAMPITHRNGETP